MSDNEEYSAQADEQTSDSANLFDPMTLSEHVKQSPTPHEEKSLTEEISTHFHLLDPEQTLPLNTEKLTGSAPSTLESILSDVEINIELELDQIRMIEEKIKLWKESIEKNLETIEANRKTIKQNNAALIHDMKNRDYWRERADKVFLDFQYARAGARETDWSWLIKKYELKNPEGNEIDAAHPAIEEVCNGEINNLAGQYQAASNRCEQHQKNREEENIRLIQENSNHLAFNDTLQGYINHTLSAELAPIQSGVLLMTEFKNELQMLQQGEGSTFGDMREWSETFLDEFLKSNPKVETRIVTEFRKLASIPLPPNHWQRGEN